MKKAFENMEGKGENDGNKHFSPLSPHVLPCHLQKSLSDKIEFGCCKCLKL